jgi:glycosyltransferase involved in cell wall biosynthesis
MPERGAGVRTEDRDAPRVLMVSSLWPPAVLGGAELYASQLASNLEQRGWATGVLTLGVAGPEVVAEVTPWPYRLDAYADQSAVRRIAFHATDLYRPATRRVLGEAVSRFAPDVVHSHSVQGLSSSALTTPSARHAAHVHTIHDYWLLCQRASLTRRDGTPCESRCRGCVLVSGIRNRLIDRHPPDVVVAVSEAVAREHGQVSWLRDRIRVIHNPTEMARIPKIPHHGVVFGYLGRLTGIKGVSTLLDAFSRARVADVRLLVAGEGPLRARLEQHAPASVEFLGWIDGARRARLFGEIDCLVVPSEWKDPAPLVVNEARAAGIPVIGARIGGIPELVPPASAELLFRPGDAGELARRIEAVAAAPDHFADHTSATDTGWAHHLDLIEGAYREARASSLSRRGESGRRK